MFCCVCEPRDPAQSLGDDARTVVTRPKWRGGACCTLNGRNVDTECGSFISMGGQLGPSVPAQNKDAGESGCPRLLDRSMETLFDSLEYERVAGEAGAASYGGLVQGWGRPKGQVCRAEPLASLRLKPSYW